MPIRPLASGNKLRSQIPGTRLQPMAQHSASTLSKGMNTSFDPADLDPAEFVLAKNSRMRFDKASRRWGTLIVSSPVKPNSLPIMMLASIALPTNANIYTLRATRTTIHVQAQAGSWSQLTGTVLLGGISDYMTGVVVNLPNAPTIPFVFTNNGQNQIQQVNPLGGTYADLRASGVVDTRYRTCFAFYNRVIGLALANQNEIQVGWSGDSNITVWDPLVDNTAGSGPLIDSPGDTSDFITGGKAFTSIGIILRRKSIWHATKLPTPQNPFNFYSAIPGIGCDCPNSIVVTTQGLAWLDTRTATVWSYIPGQWPTPIGRKIEKNIIGAISDPNQVYASYDAKNFEYSIGIAQPSTGITLVYTYNYRNQTWVYDEQPNVTILADIPLNAGGLSINQLTGTIQNLQGTIASLGGSTGFPTGRVYGLVSGDIAIENQGSTNDQETSAGIGGIAFNLDLQSKQFTLPHVDEYIARLRIDYLARSNTILQIQYSKDGGNTWTIYKTVNVMTLNTPLIFTAKKTIRARKFMWRLISSKGDFDLLGYEVDYFPGAESRV